MRHIQNAVEAYKSPFYKRISDPAITSHSQAKPALEAGLKVFLEAFNAKLEILADEWEMAALTVSYYLSARFSQMDVDQPQFANKKPMIFEPFGHEMWQESENDLKAVIDKLIEKIMIKPEQDSDSDAEADVSAEADSYAYEPTIQRRSNHNEDSSLNNQDKEEELKLLSFEFASRAVNIGTKPSTTTTPAYAMHAEDYVVDGLPADGWLDSFNKSTPGSWIACAGNYTRYAIDSREDSAYKMADGAESYVMKMLTKDSVQVVFQRNATAAVYLSGIEAGSLQHDIKSITCSDGYTFSSRFITSNDTGVYYLSDTNLVCYTWASLSMLDFNACSILQTDVIDFDLSSDSYVCITTRNTLTKDGVDMSDTKSLPCHRHLTTVGIVGSHTVCSATVTDDSVVIQAYDMNGVFESSRSEERRVGKEC